MEQQPHLNDHNKQEYPPMHTTEHIINQTMIRLFGCGRSISAHIERKKSKLDYLLAACPTEEEIKKLEEAVNEVIARHNRIHYARGSARTFRLGTPARWCFGNGTCRESRRLRRMPLHRSTCGEYIRNRNLQNHQSRLGRRSQALENAF
jgi:hypothetical protein